MMNINRKKGVSLIEAVIGITILLIFVVGIASGAIVYLKLMEINGQKSKAALLLEEGFEAMRVMRDTSWTSNVETLTPGDPYWIIFESGTYKATTTVTYIDGINRYVVLEEVNRDSNDDISATGTLDSGMRKILMTVEWSADNATTTVVAEGYLRNQYEN